MINQTTTFYSINDETFEFETVGDAIDALALEQELKVGISYYSHEFKTTDLMTYLNAEQVLENATIFFNDNIRSDDGLDPYSVRQPAKDELDDLLKHWGKKYLYKQKFYEPTGKSTKHILTEGDCNDYN